MAKRSRGFSLQRLIKWLRYALGEIVSWFGVPVAGPLVDALWKYVFEKGQIPGQLAALLHGRDAFLNYDSQELIATYSAEQAVEGSLPYVEISNWCDLDSDQACNALQFRSNAERFVRKKWSGAGEDVVLQGYIELIKAGNGARANQDTIRVEKAVCENGVLTLDIRQAEYHDQMHSNLIMDFEHQTSDGQDHTLRQLLLEETPARLPDLSTPHLANTLGVATIVTYQDGGREVPYLVVRSRDTAVFNLGSAWHCTSSYAARWEETMSACQGNLFDVLRPFLFFKMEKECGLTEADVSQLRPIAFCRELVRGGKPQLFCTARTALPYEKLKERLARARSTGGKRLDVEAMPVFRTPPDAVSNEQIAETLKKHGITSEAAACLYYWLKSTRK